MCNILPSLDIEMQRKFQNLFKHVQHIKDGNFVEVGANDGILDSYTYPLELDYNWTGVMIEPSQVAFNKCKLNRPKSVCVNVAITNDINTLEVVGDFSDGHCMASVNGNRRTNSNQIFVPSTTLTNIFDNYITSQVDLLSIDVENYEIEVLKGLDFVKYRPKYILIEIYTSTYNTVVDILNMSNYDLVDNISNFNHTDNPGWDGTHNDYLFVSNLSE